MLLRESALLPLDETRYQLFKRTPSLGWKITRRIRLQHLLKDELSSDVGVENDFGQSACLTGVTGGFGSIDVGGSSRNSHVSVE